ncbi:MAG: DUF4198 domain-containing protein [Hyphomicrobiales bacterium]
MKPTLKSFLLALPLSLAVSQVADAHRSWLLPSTTVLSSRNAWVTIDAARSNDLFYFDHNAMLLGNVGGQPEELSAMRRRNRRPAPDVSITAPDGASIAPKFGNVGRYRTTFDIPLEQAGTYRIAVVSSALAARFTVNGENGRAFGDEESLKKEIPAEAKDVKITETHQRVETFVTMGKPSGLKPSGDGLELVPVTHPNDLYADEQASFRLMLDGRPASNVKVTWVRGGSRYRNAPETGETTTDADGGFAFTWAEPGMYWITASASGNSVVVKDRPRRASYSATLEVLPQ